MRAELLSALTTTFNTNTTFKCSQELPWGQNGQPLYLKNLKKIYLDQEYNEQSTAITVFNGSDIYDDVTRVTAYLAVDAKNPPTGLDAAISQVLAAKNATGVATNAGSESDYTVETNGDVLLYTFEFRVASISY